MALIRKAIPKKIEREVLFRNRNQCCICYKTGVQIHHIDGNNSNNKVSNLAVLCLDHHNAASSVSSMTKGFDPILIKRYKADWEGQIAKSRNTYTSQTNRFRSKKEFYKERVEFELKRLIYSLPTKSGDDITVCFDQIYYWYVFEDNRSYIINQLSEIHWFLNETQMKVISPRIFEFFWHYVDPKDIPINQKGKSELFSGLELLSEFNQTLAAIDGDLRTLEAVANGISNFIDIYELYKVFWLKNKIIKEVKSMIDDWEKAKGWMQTKTKGDNAIRILGKYLKLFENLTL